eukprot:Anaeramoba_ignava/c21679_g1_i1.p2 GENE.c21679_g1_i1~~c21679_g1_i1.p2  ORF type:complete len:348 (+),score=135.79 c21679_g1_i1:49-1044(+)
MEIEKENSQNVFKKLFSNIMDKIQFYATESSNFPQYLNQKYGKDHPNFFEGNYQEAVNYAKISQKLLFVYLHSDPHFRTPDFCKNILYDNQIVDILNNDFVCWGAFVQQEQGFRISRMLEATTYPFIGIICFIPEAQTLWKSLEGDFTKEDLLKTLQSNLEKFSVEIAVRRYEEEQAQESKIIRENQDKEYYQSLILDQEREREELRELEQKKQKIEEEKQKKIAEEQKEKDKKEMLETFKKRLPKEPTENNQNTLTIAIKLPDSSRIQRKFLKTDTLRDLYDWVQIKSPDLIGNDFELAKNFPTTHFQNNETSLSSAGILNFDMLYLIKN